MKGFEIYGMFSDFKLQAVNLLFLLIPIGKAIIDVYFTQKKGKGVRHKKSLAVALAVGALFSFIDWKVSPVTYLIQSMLLGIGVFFLIFDYLRNIFAGKHWSYIDIFPDSDTVEDSSFDVKFYSKFTPLTLLLFKLWVFGVAFSIYYFASYL